jgi:hypothetical protein
VELVDVSGRITLDGEPLSGAIVTFDDPVDETFSYGRTDEDGYYTLQFDSEMAGVKAGRKVVRISTTRKLLALSSNPGADEGGDPDAGPKDKESVPEKYNKKSELTVDVTDDQSTYDFELSTNG